MTKKTVKATALSEIRKDGERIQPGWIFDCDADDFVSLLAKKRVRVPTDIDLALHRLREEGTIKVTKARKPRKAKAPAAEPDPVL